MVIVRWNEADGPVDVTPPFSARTIAHEYGGGWYAVNGGTVYFSNLDDGRIYRCDRGHAPVALTEEGPFHYGDVVADPTRSRLLCVREDMSAEPEPRDALVAVDVAPGAIITVLTDGYDFIRRRDPAQTDSVRLTVVAAPEHASDTSELWVAEVDAAGGLTNPRMVAGGGEESVVQPERALRRLTCLRVRSNGLVEPPLRLLPASDVAALVALMAADAELPRRSGSSA